MIDANLDADNLVQDTKSDGEFIQEPSYNRYIRTQGFTIDEILESKIVYDPGSESETAHLCTKIQTYLYPVNDPRLDYADDGQKITIWTCDCWSFRQGSADVANGELIVECDSCKHLEAIDKSLKAQNDEQQATLLDQA